MPTSNDVRRTYGETFLTEVVNLPSKRAPKPKKFDSYCLNPEIIDRDASEPTNFCPAISSEHADHWKSACDSEIQSLNQMQTRELVDAPQGKIFSDANGSSKLSVMERKKSVALKRVWLLNV